MALLSPSCKNKSDSTEDLSKYLDAHDIFLNDEEGKALGGGTASYITFFSAQENNSQNPQFQQIVEKVKQGGWTPEKYEKAKSLFSKNPKVPYAIIIFGSSSSQSATLRMPSEQKTVIGINSSEGADHFTDEKYVQYLGEHELIHFILSKWQPTLIDAENYPTALNNFVQLYLGPNWKIPRRFYDDPGLALAFSEILFPLSGQDAYRANYQIEEAILIGYHARKNPTLAQYYFDHYWLPKQDQALSKYRQNHLRLFELTWGMANAYLYATLLNKLDTATKLRNDYIQVVGETEMDPLIKEHIDELFDYCVGVYTNVSSLLEKSSTFKELHDLYSAA